MSRLYQADNARCTIKGLDFAAVPSAKLNDELEELFNLLDEFSAHGLKPRCESGLGAYQYSFGYLTSFIYSSFYEVKATGLQIDQMLHQRLQPSLMISPGIFPEIPDSDWNALGGFHNDIGLRSNGTGMNYSHDVPTWHSNREAYFRLNQTEIDWSDRTAPIPLKYPNPEFLPNPERTRQILLEEIDHEATLQAEESVRRKGCPEAERAVRINEEKRQLLAQWEKIFPDPGLRFHEQVMRSKGPAIHGYAKEIGKRICETNFYVYEPDLTNAECRASGDSMRQIFSLTGHMGDKQYISIDFKHGMFEFHDHQGTHLGERRFDGSYNKKADPTHNLRTL